jgi:hypothetical protein
MNYDLPGCLTFTLYPTARVPLREWSWAPSPPRIRIAQRKAVRERKRWKKIHAKQGRH